MDLRGSDACDTLVVLQKPWEPNHSIMRQVKVITCRTSPRLLCIPIIMSLDHQALLRIADVAIGTITAILTFYFLRAYVKTRKASLPLPPSPRSYPIIGNLLDLPPPGTQAAEWWSRHKKLYGKQISSSMTIGDLSVPIGPISSVSVLGSTFIILNDKDTALDLFERRSQIYSSRPSFTMARL